MATADALADGSGTRRRGMGPWRRAVFRLLLALSWLAQRLPDGPIYRIAFALGAGVYLVQAERRALARANLQRVLDWLVADGSASPRVAAAAGDPRRREVMLRATFGYWMVSYVESALAPRYRRSDLLERVRRVDPEAAEAALTPPPPGGVGQIQMAMHYGSVDLSAIYGARVGTQPLTGPMEEMSDPLARAWFEHVRRELEVTIVPLSGAARELLQRVSAGEMVGLVADRVVTGKGAAVELFGATARLPMGPAMLAVESGATIYLQALLRTSPGHWDAHTVPIAPDPELSRRAAVRSIMEQEARAFERIVALAPEQWITLLFPIWADLDGD